MNKRSVQYQAIDEAFYKDGYQLANTYFANGLSKESLFSAVKHQYHLIDELIDSFSKRCKSENQTVDCKKGCSHCCNQTVLATPVELFYLVDYCKKHFSDDRFLEITLKANEQHILTSELTLKKQLQYKQPCPLLHPEGGYCRAYPARPMACRIYLSKNVQSCINDLTNPTNDKIYPKLFDLPLHAGRMMNEGFVSRLRNFNIDPKEITIESGIVKALENNKFEMWMKGEKFNTIG